jgi:hypothetical protein
VVAEFGFRKLPNVDERTQAANDETLEHLAWDFQFHVVFITKCWGEALSAQWRRDIGPTFWDLVEQRERQLEERQRMDSS